jgi:phosphoribosyl 1,2-cyclic phosphate phosphodiesterase
MSLRFTILGCGSSGGVPRPGSGWGACNPAEPRNRRRRCSLLIEKIGRRGSTHVLIDTSPDLREQLIAAGVEHLDGVILTHEHADHTHGIDDLRPIVLHQRRLIDVWMDAPTSAVMRVRFGYCFETPPGSDYPPILVERRAMPGSDIVIEGEGGPVTLTPFELEHGSIKALGLRVDGVAYTPDVSAIPDAALPYLDGLDVWIIDALRHRPHPTHFSLSEALEWIGRQKPKQAILTNLHTDLDYGALRQDLPEQIQPAFDGLQISVDAGNVYIV